MKVGSAWKCPQDCTRPARPARGAYGDNPPCANCGRPLFREGTMEVSVVVAFEKNDGTTSMEFVGLCFDPETQKMVGVIPGTPASKLDAGYIAEQTGWEWDLGAYLRGFSLPQGAQFTGPDSEARARGWNA